MTKRAPRLRPRKRAGRPSEKQGRLFAENRLAYPVLAREVRARARPAVASLHAELRQGAMAIGSDGAGASFGRRRHALALRRVPVVTKDAEHVVHTCRVRGFGAHARHVGDPIGLAHEARRARARSLGEAPARSAGERDTCAGVGYGRCVRCRRIRCRRVVPRSLSAILRRGHARVSGHGRGLTALSIGPEKKGHRSESAENEQRSKAFGVHGLVFGPTTDRGQALRRNISSERERQDSAMSSARMDTRLSPYRANATGALLLAL